MFVDINVNGECIRVREYSLRTSFDSGAGGVWFFIWAVKEDGIEWIIYSSQNLQEACAVYEELAPIVNILGRGV